jgi:hypothetical protein
MKNLFEKLKHEIFAHFDEPYQPNTLQLIRQRTAIRKQLIESKTTGKVVGIYCPSAGSGMLLTCVDDIVTIDKQEVIIFKPFDMNGIMLNNHHIPLTEIKTVCPFESFYFNPAVKKEKEFVFNR